jgi:hypothetical protein
MYLGGVGGGTAPLTQVLVIGQTLETRPDQEVPERVGQKNLAEIGRHAGGRGGSVIE